PHTSMQRTGTTCPGCGKSGFTLRGFSNHLTQATDLRCINTRDQHFAATLDTPPALAVVDLDAQPVPFQGDFFGNYGPGDFPEQGPQNNHIPPGSDGTVEHVANVHKTPRMALKPPPMSTLCEPNTVVIPFPLASAAAPTVPTLESSPITDPTYTHYREQLERGATKASNPFAPFQSETDWLVARWAKLRGPGSTAFTELLAIPGLAKHLALSYKTSQELNAIIDCLPAGRPRFKREEVEVAGESFEVYFRDITECIRSLLGDPEFAPLLLLVPEKHFTDHTKTTQVFFDMNTGKWWWTTQEALEKERPGATVIPVIISSDKTQLTLIGNKSAYPVYLTLGNLPKEIRCKPSRRSQILVAYLPTSRLLHIPNKASRRRALANLFHACMTRVLSPLADAGLEGMHFATGDGLTRRGHPILATYIGDYPEQLLVMCGKNGECPKCEVHCNDLGASPDTSRPFRDLGNILDALAAIDEGVVAFTKACVQAGIKPVYEPFWENLPYPNIFVSITPDILHPQSKWP
ncbi:hypothetical protein BD413DRAFT_474708, partial [Trametes elegans]